MSEAHVSEGIPGFIQIPGGAQVPQRNDDGRNVNPDTGLLLGEGAEQIPLASRDNAALQAQVFPHVPSHQPIDSPSYYGVPVLKEPVWIGGIAGYFYVGGLSGMAATLGSAAQLVGGRQMDGLVTKTRWIATAGATISTVLLISDLGRPERFLHMLRVFKLTSPMSMGSWILSAFGASAGAAAVLPLGPRRFRPLAGVFGLLAGLLGLPLAAYTGVLIVQTAVPLWRNPLWSVLALCSGTAAATSLLDLLPLNEKEARAVGLFGVVGKVGELLLANAIENEASRVERVTRPLHDGFTGFLWQSAKVLVAGSAILTLVPGHSRKRRIVIGVLGTTASVCVRFAYFFAGKRSARDPRATFEQQRTIPALHAGEIKAV
jgi:formate-dependent nitrite reductase membrane component NrfD